MCVVFINSFIERSLFFNMEVFNKIVELKICLFNRFDESVYSFIVKFNKNIFLELWFSFFNLKEMKIFYFNIIVSGKLMGVFLYFRNMIEKVVGLKVFVMNKYIVVEGIWLNGKILKEVVVFLYCNEIVVSKLFLILLINDKWKMV